MICILCMSAKLSNLWHAKLGFAALRFDLKQTIPDYIESTKISSGLFELDRLGMISMIRVFSELRHRTIRLFCSGKFAS